jgi:glycerophosphoryl diester phosphodiesterase
MAGLDWLTARPIAHRGLHDAANNIVENTASAFSAAIAGNYGIECDLQISAAEIMRAPFKKTSDRIMTLGELCDLVAGRSVLVIEMKSHFSDDARLPARVAAVLQNYAGPVAVMSFDPRQIVALSKAAPGLPRGIVAEGRYDHPEWSALTGWEKYQLAHLLHGFRTRPHFIAYGVKDLPAIAPLVARFVFGMPLLTWTVRSEADRKRARRYASQMVFEGFRP